MLYIIANKYSLTEFLLESLCSIDRKNVLMHPRRIKGIAYSLLKVLDAWTPVELFGFQSFPEDYLLALRSIPEDASVLIFGIENIKDLRIIRKNLHVRRVSIFTWNPVIDYQQNYWVRQLHIRQMKSLGFQVFTFDPADSKHYGLVHTSQVYRRVDGYSRSVDTKWDIYFLGQDKGRFDTLRNLGEKWRAMGLNTRLCMLPERHRTYPEQDAVEILQCSIDYAANLNEINYSRCLLELNQVNQMGITVRCLEAIFFDKKLITNNADVRSMAFYDPSRFFILDYDDPVRFCEFLEEPTPRIPSELLDRHDFSHWLRQFE